MASIRTLRLDIGEVTLRETGILTAKVFPNSQIELKDAVAFFNIVEIFTNKEIHASVIDITGLKGLSNDAREYMVKECDEWGTTACVAFVSNSIFSRVIGNLFLTISRPNYPVKIFEDQANAQQWAKKHYLQRVSAIA